MDVEPTAAGRRQLTRRRVVDAAVALADRDGLDAVTMRRVAATLGVGAMSLYRHTRDRDDLLMAMTERVTAQFPMTTGPGAGWRAVLADLADVEWRCYRAHPWLREVRPLQLPLDTASREQFEHVMGALLRTGADPAECYAAVLAVGSVVFGAATMTIAPSSSAAGPGANRSALSALEDVDARRDPAVASALEVLAATTPRSALERALGRLLDGFEPVFGA